MIDKSDLLKWLSKIDKKLEKKITLIAIGGTAMTLLGLKSSTRDIDLCLDGKDLKDFEKVMGKGFVVHLFSNGYIFSEQLPDDYIEGSKEIVTFKNILLKALHPIDIIITKAARLNARDEEDIQTLARYANKKELMERFEQIIGSYAGNEEDYRYHFNLILKRFFEG